MQRENHEGRFLSRAPLLPGNVALESYSGLLYMGLSFQSAGSGETE